MRMKEMSDLNGFDEHGSFIQCLAQYYSDFLSTDFKKGSLPKRRFQMRDRKGRRSGIPLEKFPSFFPKLTRLLKKKFGAGLSLSVKLGEHQANLPAVVVNSIKACIKNLDFSGLEERNAEALENFKKNSLRKNCDLEIECTDFITQLRRNVGLEIGAKIIDFLQPVFERSASNLVDALILVEDDITELFVSPFEDALPSALAHFMDIKTDERLITLMDEAFSVESGKTRLASFFEDFSASDLFTELRELSSVEQLDDNLEYYLYLGEIKYKSHKFPLFYVPFKLEMEGTKFNLTLEQRILVNKKAIDYIARVIQEETKTSGASSVDRRIIYIDSEQTLLETVDGLIQKVLRAFQFDGSISVGSSKTEIKNASVALANSHAFALFDKSDESMLTDYEELLDKLGQGGGKLLDFLGNLVRSFFEENPTSITEEVFDYWDEMDTPNRLVFDTPIPLAEEQRKILNALNNSAGKFIIVQGPPGTGKSHTISAIAFGAILKEQSILVLSDKKEALDVVENKLNETLAKVRPSDDFINPILRLGRVGSNFTKLTTPKSVDNLRVQHREIKKEHKERDEIYQTAVSTLKKQIENRANKASKINVTEIFEMEEEIAGFKEKYSDFPNFIEIFDAKGEDYQEELSVIDAFLNLRSICVDFPSDFLTLCGSFGDDAKALGRAIGFINLVLNTAKSTGVFELAPRMSYEKIEALNDKITEIKNAKGLFGYLFSGNKLRQIKEDVQDLIGFRTRATSGNRIIAEMNYLLQRGRSFYEQIIDQFDNKFHLIPDVLSLKEIPDLSSDLSSALINLQNLIDNDELPFLGDEETVVETLTSRESGEAGFFETFSSLRKESAKRSVDFEFEEYNYLARKTEIENYNALELATKIDGRVINFADKYKNDAHTLSQIIKQKKKFPRNKFDVLKSAFPCMICSLRDYAEYIPLEKELFDIIIIDEASQVSIAQAFPAIIRAKKMIILGDKKQFGNVKTSNASKELNNAYFTKLKGVLLKERGELGSYLETKIESLNISNSILDFMKSFNNFDIMLKKHFRSYPEMISFSSKYFYDNDLQVMKIRGKPIGDVLEFIKVESDGKLDLYKNTNELEAATILNRILKQLDNQDMRSVAVITPFTDQQTYISKIFSDHQRYQEILEKLRFRCFTFDSCQGEERDIIYYSFVASPEKDRLWAVLPRLLEGQGEDELDRNKRMQRLNVAFSRGKEKLVFVHSKPIAEMSAGREVLNHFAAVLSNAKKIPTVAEVDPNSEAEKKVLEWIQKSPMYVEYQPEIIPQFEIGKYLKTLDENYHHPAYRVDFLLCFNVGGKQRNIVLEYDGFEYHFDNRDEIDAGNWQHYLTRRDIERDHVLESYGYKILRINKFNRGDDPIQTLSDRIADLLRAFDDKGDALIKTVLDNTVAAHEGFKLKTYRHCRKCDQNKPTVEFEDKETKTGYRRFCKTCTESTKKKKRKSRRRRTAPKIKQLCPGCFKRFPLSEFIDKSGMCSMCRK